MYTQVGSCPVCGAPIYAPTEWNGVIPPPSIKTCGCASTNKVVVTSDHTT